MILPETFSYGLTGNLIVTALITATACFIVASKDLGLLQNSLLALIRVSLPLIYFAYFYDGTWNFRDDIAYLEDGHSFLSQGYHPLTTLFSPEARSALKSLAGGDHFLYIWWNALAEFLFGPYYYSPVFLNIILTYICGFFFFRTIQLSNFAYSYGQQALVFFLLHWDILTWSSFINLKDIMVMTLTSAAIFFTIRLTKHWNFADLLSLFLICYISLWIRRYFPLLLFAAIFCWIIISIKGRRKILLSVSIILAAILFNFLFSSSFSFLSYLNISNLLEMPFNIIKMYLTPQPWSIIDKKIFLLPASIIHWFLTIPTLIGLAGLWRHSKQCALLIIYLLIGLFAFGIFGSDDIQGPRHRLQFSFILSFAQFHFFYIMNQYFSSTRLRLFPAPR
jgi:hypothetical protein